jgi:large subunit ribosomal protein L5
MQYVPSLKEKYKNEIIPALMKEFGYKSVMQCPKLTKIIINQGIGDAVADKKIVDNSVAEITAITGQKPVPALSRKDISNFRLRKGMPIGVMVTLRRDRMYEFLERLIVCHSRVSATSTESAASSTARVTTPSVSKSR